HATPRQLLASFVRVAAGAGFALDPGHRQVLIDGLRGAAGYGTARGLGDAGIPALAKTGTAPRSGATVGLVVAVLPPDRPTHAIVVVAPGAAGVHATAIAVERLRGRPGIGGPGGFDLPAVTIGRPSGDGYEVATVGLEDYVANVVAGEAAPGSGSEALKAMAIVARTFALANQRRHGSEGFDLCTLTHCQVVGRATAATRAAAEATRGLALAYGGRPAQVFYTASCGGHTERPSAVWSGAPDPPYLVAMAEPACRLDAPWSSDVSAAQVSAAMRASGARGSVVRSLRVVSRTGSGRAAALEVGGFDPPIVAAETFRLALGRTAGWQLVRSTAFEVERRAGGYRFVGRGRGHGVGLCVEGAARLAREGRTARAILLHYFPGSGAELLQSGPPAPAPEQEPAVEVLLPAGAEGDRAMLARLARAALSEAARSAGLPAPQRVRLVFHPTTQAYSRATGLPWWTAGSARGSQVDLLPPPALRGRGLLERTVRHEMAHVVVGGRLAGRPLWAQEGAAMFLAGELEVRGGALEPVAAVPPCPADAEISPGRSAAAARDAYRRAAACFQRELRAGRRWNEIGAAVGAAPR
ncbi:MAG: hypothetical protein H6Q10_3347, partial [Acidobacteria bacterium]|nr:hypothetical protein [Acidobacteriota bacterium]